MFQHQLHKVWKAKGAVGILLSIILLPARTSSVYAQQDGCRTFTETDKTVCGRFLQYWNDNGGLAQQGYPISDEIQERSDLNGKTYTVQYFERAVFESHPENQAPYDVLLSQLGTFRYKAKYGGTAPGQQPNKDPGSMFFEQTGHFVGGAFLGYWNTNGGLAQQGYPLSDEFTEVSDLDGKSYRVQYFERAVFEFHPENQPPYNVLLSQLGKFRHQDKYEQVDISKLPIAPKIGAVAPDFELPDLRTGKAVKLSTLRGKPVIVTFWQTWCGYCKDEFPRLETIYQKYSGHLEIVGLSGGQFYDPKEELAYINDGKYSWTFLHCSDDKVQTDYQITGFPNSYFIDRYGVIRAIAPGDIDANTMNNYLAKILR